MKILNIYDDRDDAEAALQKLSGDKKIVSDREDNKVIYKLFGPATWGNLYRLNMFNLHELKALIEARDSGAEYDMQRHQELINMMKYAASSFDLIVPDHWK